MRRTLDLRRIERHHFHGGCHRDRQPLHGCSGEECEENVTGESGKDRVQENDKTFQQCGGRCTLLVGEGAINEKEDVANPRDVFRGRTIEQ